MRIWIIGKNGMLAKAFQRICKEEGLDFIATSKKEVDLSASNDLQAQFETLSFSHIINCSGYTAVDHAENSGEQAYLLNVTCVENLARLSSMYKKKLIHFSTDYVFDGQSNLPYTEENGCNPLSIYGKTKREGEEKLLSLCPEACLIRTSWLFGKEGSHFVKTMMKLMREKESIRVVSDQVGRPTFCDDLVRATLTLLDQNGLFHVANSDEVSWHGFATEIYRCLKIKNIPMNCREILPIKTKEYGAVANRPPYSVLSTIKFERQGNFSLRSWKECLHEVIDACHVS